MKKKKIIVGLVLFAVVPSLVLAEPPKPPSGGMEGNMPGGKSSSSVSHKGNTELSSNTEESDKTYASVTGGENALLVSSGNSTINSCTVTKSGDESDENSDFYGTNAGIFVYNGATLNIKGGTVTTNGSHANGVFSYDTGIINISDVTINTTGNNSGGVMVTGGGTLNATNLNVKTTGNSSASIRSDRGGGNLTVTGGSYETTGVGSPSIYSTASIVVSNSTLTSTSSEGVVVEGKNSVTLNNVNLTDTNNSLNGNSETYKNIFLYQSMSGDADEGEAVFTASNSNIITNKGDTIFVTNTTATINLENNIITNNDGDFLRIQTGKWGNSGSNGGDVTLNLNNQKINGNIIVDSISTLNMNLKNGSVFIGSIDSDNQAKKIKLTLSSDSVIFLTKDTYVDTLENEVSDNSNIYLNGYKLYVDGKETMGNSGSYTETTTKDNNTVSQKANESKNYSYIYIIEISVIVLCSTLIVILKKRK